LVILWKYFLKRVSFLKRSFFLLALLFLSSLLSAQVVELNKIRHIVSVKAPIFPELKSSLVLQKINHLKKDPKKKKDDLLLFILGVAYYEEGKYRQAYDTLKNLRSVEYLDDYLKYYTAMSVLKYSQSAKLLSSKMELIYSLFNKGNGALAADVKSILPESEFKIAKAFINAHNFNSSLDYYTRAKTRGYSSLKEEFELVRTYLSYDGLIAKSFLLDLAKNFPESEVRILFDKLPLKLREELYILSAYDSVKQSQKIKTDYSKTETSLISSIKEAIDSENLNTVKKLSIEYLDDYPRGNYKKRFYDLLNKFIDNELFIKEKSVDSYKSLFSKYDRQALERVAIKFFQKPNLNQVEKVLKIILAKDPYYERGWFLLASLYEDKGDNSKAQKYYKKIVDGFPQSTYYSRALFKYAWLAMINSNYTKCMDVFDQYIEEGWDKFEWSVTAALYFKSKCALKKGKREQSQEAIELLRNEYPYSFYSIISMNENALSLVEHIGSNIRSINYDLGALSPQDLKMIRTSAALVRAGLFDWAVKELSFINIDKLSAVYVDVLSNIYKYASNPHMSIVAASKLMNIIRGYTSMEHAQMHYPKHYFDNVKKFSEAYNIEPYIMLAIMKRESAFQKDAVSSAGAQGLMQLMPATASFIDPNANILFLKDPEKNIRIAAVYIKRLMKKYKGNLVYVLASYNAGEEALDRWITWYGERLDAVEFIENIPYMETRNYVKSVISNYYMYNALYSVKDLNFEDLIKMEFRDIKDNENVFGHNKLEGDKNDEL
jgi:hypothetical protein